MPGNAQTLLINHTDDVTTLNRGHTETSKSAWVFSARVSVLTWFRHSFLPRQSALMRSTQFTSNAFTQLLLACFYHCFLSFLPQTWSLTPVPQPWCQGGIQGLVHCSTMGAAYSAQNHRFCFCLLLCVNSCRLTQWVDQSDMELTGIPPVSDPRELVLKTPVTCPASQLRVLK